jgi:siroheme synthase
MNHGKVTLVGAGPGDPELLTLKALKAIQRATVLLVDDLVSEEIVAFARPEARIVYVGKRGGCKSTPQAFIEKLMLMAAREGEDVVRLKGGDPFIFGRGGEEVEHLRDAGIAVEVVNGITSGLAAVTSLGVPLTHREHAHGVVFRHRPCQAGRQRHRLAGAGRHRAQRAPHAGDLHGRQRCGAHPGRAADRPAGRHTGRRDPERLAGHAAPHHHHAGHAGRIHARSRHGQPRR